LPALFSLFFTKLMMPLIVPLVSKVNTCWKQTSIKIGNVI